MLVHCPYCPQAFDPGSNADPSRLACPSCGKVFDLSARQTRSIAPGQEAPPPPDEPDTPPLLEPGTEIGGFRVVEQVGRGGMGVVYKAVQLSLDRTVALKILPPSLAKQSRFLERFDREARALAELSHPNIVSIIDRGVEGDVSFIVMEFVDGVSLREVMAAGGLTPNEALAIVPKICAAMEYAHGRGIVHRDIKPENIMLDRQGGVKVADFGLSRIVAHDSNTGRITGTNVVMGTFDYMSPEQRERTRDVDHRSDIYSLGVVLYELLTGELPMGRFEAPSQRRQGLDARLDEVVFKVLDKDPTRRYQRASELSRAVSAIAGESSGAAAGSNVAPLPPASSRARSTPARAAHDSTPRVVEPAVSQPMMRLPGWAVVVIVVGVVALLVPACICVPAFWLLASGSSGDGGTSRVPPPGGGRPVKVFTATPAPVPVPATATPPAPADAAPADGDSEAGDE